MKNHNKPSICSIAANEYKKSCVKLERGSVDRAGDKVKTLIGKPETLCNYSGNILIILFGGIGDIIVSMRAIFALKRQNPDIKITYLSQYPATQVFAINNLNVENFIDINQFLSDDLSVDEIGLKLLQFSDRMRQNRFQLIFNFDHTIFSACIATLCKGKIIHGLHYNNTGLLCTSEAGKPIWNLYHDLEFRKKNSHHLNDYFFNFLGLARERLVPVGKKFRKKRGVIAFHPGTNWISKRWHIDNYSKLASLLIAKGVKIMVLGGKNEIDIQEGLLNNFKNKNNFIPLVGEYELNELPSILEKIDLLVSNDTGPMHLCDYLGIPLIALFGPTNPNESGPKGEESYAISSKYKCTKCFQVKCSLSSDYGECMDYIKSEQIFSKIIKVIGYD